MIMDKIKIRLIAIKVAKKITTKNAGITALLQNAEDIYRCIIEGNYTPEVETKE